MNNNRHYKSKIYIDCGIGMPDPNEDRSIGSYQSALDLFTKHLSTLTSYLYTGTNLKDGQVVVHGIDYEFKTQVLLLQTGNEQRWADCTKIQFVGLKESESRIVAIPKEQPEQKCACDPNHTNYEPGKKCIGHQVLTVACLEEQTQEQLWNNGYLEYKQHTNREEPLSAPQIAAIAWFSEYMQKHFTITRK